MSSPNIELIEKKKKNINFFPCGAIVNKPLWQTLCQVGEWNGTSPDDLTK
jgi:hypothetical protein